MITTVLTLGAVATGRGAALMEERGPEPPVDTRRANPFERLFLTPPRIGIFSLLSITYLTKTFKKRKKIIYYGHVVTYLLIFH